MADNANATAGDGTIIIATDKIGGVDYQRVKLTAGADGTATDLSVGAGAVGTGVLRITLASDDPLVVLAGSSDAQLPTALGATTAAASLSVTLATNDPLTATIHNEDTAATGADKGISILAVRNDTDISLVDTTGDYANLQVSALGFLKVENMDGLLLTPASQTSAATLFTQDMQGYESITVQVTSAGSACTITYECSDDNSTWLGIGGYNPAATQSSIASVLTTTTAVMTRFQRAGRYFRARVSTYGSGTVTVVGSLNKGAAPSPATANVSGTITAVGVQAHDGALTGNPVRTAARARNFGLPYTAVSVDDIADLVTDLSGYLKVTQEYSFGYLAATNGAGAALKAAAGVLHSVVINTAAASATLSVYDAASATNPIAIIDCATAGPRTLTYDAVFATGLYWVMAGGNANVTALYR